MKLKKILIDNEQVAPQTIAEAVLVKTILNKIEPLSKVLNRKIETIESAQGSGIEVNKDGYKITLNHSNKIAPNTQPEPLLIQHDINGHIVNTQKVQPYRIIVKDKEHQLYDGSSETTLQFGDDFELENNKLKISWNNI